MPVPVSVTHASGVGLDAAGAAELPTLGPFARLATSKDAAATTNGSTTANGDSGAPVRGEPAATPASEDSRGASAGPILDAGAAAVETSHLRFIYPGIGECHSGFSCGEGCTEQHHIQTVCNGGKRKGTCCGRVVAMQTVPKANEILAVLELSTGIASS